MVIMKFLTCFVLISASVQIGWAAAAERHWLALPVLAGVLLYVLVRAAKHLHDRRAGYSQQDAGMSEMDIKTV